ncbi:MAG TPA: hypothetical protein VHC20_06320 [Candidatus Paceibacterota bacterium]|nr:hypothetical protein [Candidatus Paceibacterota bacterium]
MSALLGLTGDNPAVALDGMSSKGLCSTNELTAQGTRALELLRQAAPPPADVKNDSLLIGDFLNTDRTAGSIRQRLQQLWGRTIGPKMEEDLGLNLQDFTDAREYLKQELLVFARSQTKTFPTVMGRFDHYAATAQAPGDRDPAYWGAVARTQSQLVGDPSAQAKYFGPYADFRYFVTKESARFASRSSVLPSSLRATVDQLALLNASASGQSPGYVKFDIAATHTDVSVHLDTDPLGSAAKIRVIRGEDGLHCATQGAIDGAACSSTDLDTATICNTTAPVPVTRTCVKSGAPTAERIYVVRSKTGLTGPGDYVSLLGAAPYGFPHAQTLPLTVSFSIAPSADRRVAEILRPNKRACSRPRLSCAGADFDERMPLENELSDDGDAVESSWRHYLTLAENAAKEADELGQNLIVSQLDADVRKETVELREEARRQETESALSELQELCGTDVDPMKLLLALSGTSDPKDLSNLRQKDASGNTVTCSSDSNCQGSSNFHCTNGICLKDLMSPSTVLATTTDPSLKQALARLSECIGDDVSAPFVSLGSEPLCVWYPNDVPSQICKGADIKSAPCPTFAKQNQSGVWNCDSMALPTGQTTSTLTVKLVDRQLGYFSSPQEPDTKPRLCQDLIEARNSSSPNLDRIIASNIFHPYNLAQLVPHIGWTAYLGGGGAVTTDGRAIFDDYSFTRWSPTMQQDCGFGGDPQFCANDKARLDDRVMRAVATIHATTDGSLRNLTLPFYIEKDADHMPESGRWTTTYPGTSVPMVVLQKGWKETDKVGEADRIIPYPNVFLSDDPFYYQYEIDTTTALAPAWRAPKADGSIQDYSAKKLSEDGRDYEFALGPMAMFVDNSDMGYDNHGLDRYIWWSGMSTATSQPGLAGNYWWAYRDSGGSFDPKVRSYLPGAPARGEAVVKNCENPCVASIIVAADCHREVNAEVTIKPPGTCQYHVVPMHEPLRVGAQELADAAEITCQVIRDVDDYQCDLHNPPKIEHPNDYAKAKSFLECTGRELSRRAALTVFSGFPERAIDALRKESAVGAYPAIGGTVGSEISDLRAALVESASIQGKIGKAISDLGNDFEVLAAALKDAKVKDEIADVQFQSSVENQLSTCAQAINGAFTIDYVAVAPRAHSAQIACANAYAQIEFSGTLEDLTKQENDVNRGLAVVEFRKRFGDRALTFSGYADQLREQVEHIDAALANIEKHRQAARRSLGRALFKASSAAAIESAITNVNANAAAVARERYSRANKNAIHLAFLAKRAIENRIGVKLADMTTDLPLVEAPATWEATVCASTGVDYAALRKDVESFQANTFADQFIGDYVRKLENLVEAYRLEHDFHEGDDTAVISLKDDVFGVRKDCEVASRNLLYYSSDLLPRAGAGAAPNPWNAYGCQTAPCATVRLMTELQGIATDPDLSQALADEIRPGAAGGGVAQDVSVSGGKYVLSWYTGTASLPTVALIGADDQPISPASQGSEDLGGYVRRWLSYEFAEETSVKVAVTAASTDSVVVGGLMLEARTDGKASGYQHTTNSLMRMEPACPDTDGDTFRRTRWTRNCMRLCANGYADACDDAAAKVECYQEATFAINQRGIESGDFLGPSGFAKGNFNYRLSDLAVNFVGTGLTGCDGSDAPNSCYGSGNLQYSLVHGGPYFVRNHEGRDARIPLFEGHIEHARGLATERYLTNPLSDSDSSLADQYRRTEFRGRPLDGNFTLRVWEKPGMNFQALEDVQLMLRYRYWTRFQ